MNRPRIFKAAPVIFAATTMVASAWASELPETAKAPAAAMEKLSALQGAWKTTTEIIDQEGVWNEQAVNHVSIESDFRGLLLTESETERLSGSEESPQLKIDYTYDQYREVYRVSVIDSGWGIMDIYEGALEAGQLTVTNIKSDTSFPLDDGGQLHFRLQIPVTGNKKVVNINLSTDKGVTWRPFYRVTYTRMAKE